MKRFCPRSARCLPLILSLLWLPSALAELAVSNVRSSQRAGTKLVDVYYNLSGTADPVTVSMRISSDDGASFTVPATALSGDFGAGITTGTNKKIVWNAGVDWNGKLSATMRFEVTASDEVVPDGMVLIPAGSFQMGDQSDPLVGDSDELPVHSVYVNAFYMGKYEVTKELWDEVKAWGVDHGYTDLPSGGGTAANYPVHSINWYAIVKWCNARSEKEGLSPCYTVGGSVYRTGSSAPDCNWNANGYRLPTEAEWEKAARGGLSGKNFPWGDTISHSQANYYSNSSYSYDVSPTRGYHPTWNDGNSPYTSPVGSFAANGYGLYDMAGNLWEWCNDWYGFYGSGSVSDPRGASAGSYRVLRGGGWYGSAFGCRVAHRTSHSPSLTPYNLGFRAVRR